MLSRRGFFGALAALVVAPRLPVVPASPADPYVNINRAVLSFWRSQAYRDSRSPALAFDQLREAMHG